MASIDKLQLDLTQAHQYLQHKITQVIKEQDFFQQKKDKVEKKLVDVNFKLIDMCSTMVEISPKLPKDISSYEPLQCLDFLEDS